MFMTGSKGVHRFHHMQLKDLALPHPPGEPADATRTAFLAGVKAAFIVGQKNRFGQILCARCGCAWDTVAGAAAALTLRNVVGDAKGVGYDPRLGWGDDDPNRLMLCCLRCIRSEVPA